MFGLRWISAVSLRWHTRPTCCILKASRLRFGWRPFLITAGYGRDFYTPCPVCVPQSPIKQGATAPKGDL